MRPRRALLFGILLVASAAAFAAVDGTDRDPADVAAAGSSPASEELAGDDAGDGSSAIEMPGVDVEIAGDEMPASEGWFLVAIEAEDPTSVHLDIRHRLDSTDDQPKIAVPFIVQHDAIYAHLSAAGHDDRVSAHAGNRQVTCCTDRFDGQRGASEIGGWFGTAPETPLFVGMAASGWSQSDEIQIQAEAPDAELEAGEIRRGTSVRAVDLYEEAREDPSVRAEGHRVLGDHENVDLRWTAEDAGLVSVAWDHEDEARGDVNLTMPEVASVDSAPSTGTRGWIAGLGGAGELELSFTEVSRSGPSQGEAFALFADVEMPYRVLDSDQR